MLTLHGPGIPLRPQAAAQVPDVEPDDADDQADADRYEDALFGLLLYLEHLRETLAAPDRRAQVPAVAGELMDRVEAFAADHGPFGWPTEANEAQARLADFRSGLRALEGQMKDGGAAALGTAPARKCFAALTEAVFAHFVAFTNRFPTSRTARGWVEVAATFVTDLRRTLRDLVAAPPV